MTITTDEDALSGEINHERGKEGVRRAKNYLESTTRAQLWWLASDPRSARKLQFSWVNGNKFTFDMGGVLQGGDLDGEIFLVESKFYRGTNGQGTMYRRFLAECYMALKTHRFFCDHFMWITWAPFLVDSWSDLMTPEYVERGVLESKERVFGELRDGEAYEDLIEPELLRAVASRLWIIVLSDKQEKHLTMTLEHLAIVRAHATVEVGR